MEKTSPWAIRDIAHGKTFSFDSWKDLLTWVLETEAKSWQEIIDQIPEQPKAKIKRLTKEIEQ